LRRVEIETVSFFKQAPKYSLQERNHNDTKVAEEYCWAIT